MPKVVDHDARRRAIARAAIEVIAEVGIDEVTMGLVGKRAGITAGTLPHYFPGKRAMLLAALSEVIQSIRDRAARQAVKAGLNPVDVCLCILPCTPEQRREWRTWLAFAGRAAHDADLTAEFLERYRQGTTDLSRILTALRELGQFPKELDAEVAAETLAALLDGLGLRATLEPDAWPKKRLASVVRKHLDSLGYRAPTGL